MKIDLVWNNVYRHFTNEIPLETVNIQIYLKPTMIKYLKYANFNTKSNGVVTNESLVMTQFDGKA